MATHTNDRPFMCPYCHKTFKTSVACRKHIKTHRNEVVALQGSSSVSSAATGINLNNSNTMINASIQDSNGVCNTVSNTDAVLGLEYSSHDNELQPPIRLPALHHELEHDSDVHHFDDNDDHFEEAFQHGQKVLNNVNNVWESMLIFSFRL